MNADKLGRSHLKLLTDSEAALLGKRAAARQRFISQYAKVETRRTMLGSLDRIAKTFSDGKVSGRDFPWDLLTDDDLALEVWGSLIKPYGAATAIRDASALKAMLKCCWKVGLLGHDQYLSAIDFSPKVPRSNIKTGRTLEVDEISQLVLYEDPNAKTALQVRDKALVLLLASTGARRNEISNIDIKHLDLDRYRVDLVVTKNGERRDAWLHESTVVALKEWLEIRGGLAGPLFVAMSRTCRPLLDRRLSSHQIWKVLSRRALDSGVGAVTPHDMRRYLVSTLLDQGVDLALVAKIVGHSDPATTAKYDRRPAARSRAAVAKLNLPSPSSKAASPFSNPRSA